MRLILTIVLIAISIVATEATEKTCPLAIPIFQGSDNQVKCDTLLNPTGNTLDDPPCQYSDCQSDRSAICGCVDYSQYGGEGMYWACIHSRCQCPTADSKITETDKCGIHGSDFQNPQFVGETPVSGQGCQLGSRTGCLCKPVIGNNVPIEDWTWQCIGNTRETNLVTALICISIILGTICMGLVATVICTCQQRKINVARA